MIAGCGTGGGGGGGGGGIGPHTPNAAVLVNLGDAPVDRVVSLDMTVNQITVTTSGGATVTVLNTATLVEFRHVAGSLEPLATATLDSDTYNQVTIVLSSTAHATVLDSVTHLPVQKTVTLGATSFNVSLSGGTVGSTPMALDIDFLMSTSVNVDASNNVTINPSFTAALVPVAASSPQVETGKIEDIDGAITSIVSPNFTINVEQSAGNLTFVTNTSTVFVGVSGLAGLAAGNLVEVTGAMQSDGTLLATKVEALDLTAGGLEADGIVTAITGAPANSAQIIVEDDASPTLTLPTIGAPLTLNGLATATFVEDTDEVSLAGLTLPAFDATTLTLGQKVQAVTSTPSTTAITASQIKLQQQAVTGMVMNSTAGGQGTSGVITLTLPSDSYLTLLTGETQVTVFQQTNTAFVGITSVPVGSNLRARGLLLFNSGATPRWQMVASRLTRP